MILLNVPQDSSRHIPVRGREAELPPAWGSSQRCAKAAGGNASVRDGCRQQNDFHLALSPVWY